jgi:type VI secretion system protein ImpK
VSALSSVAPGRLASALQEFITSVVRLRADRQPVTDAAAFRSQITGLLARAEQDAIGMGFSAPDARLAIFAVVAFLDESVLNVRSAALADWARRPLQDELFGAHMGGEWFFQHVEQLLARPDSAELADLLEVHQLCLLLGFHGKYGASDNGQLHAITSRVGDRIARLRGPVGDLAPMWAPPNDRVETTDPWLRRLTIGAVGSAVLLMMLWGTYAYTLKSTTSGIRALAPATLLTSGAPSAR